MLSKILKLVDLWDPSKLDRGLSALILRNQKISTRIGALIGLFLILMVVLTVFEISVLNEMQKKIEKIIYDSNIEAELAEEMHFMARHKAVIVRNILLLKEQSEIEAELVRLEDATKKYLKAEKRLEEMVRDDKGKTILKRIIEGRNMTESLWDQVIQLDLVNKLDEGIEFLVKEVRNKQWDWLNSLDEMAKLQRDNARKSNEEALHDYQRTRNLLIIIDIIAIISGIFFAIRIALSITQPLYVFSEKVNAIAQGDLNVEVENDKKDEIGLLGKHINHMVKKLKENKEELEIYQANLEKLVSVRTEALNSQREQFISVLIHDLKGPLTPILGFTKRLLNEKAKSREDMLLHLKTIYESSQNVMKVIEETSKKLKEKKALQSFNSEKVNISKLLLTIAKDFIPEAEDKGINILLNHKTVSECYALEEIILLADPFQLKTLIENLIGNAIKYAKKEVKVYLSKTNKAVNLVLSDDGPGIAKEYHEKIFEEYFQAPGSKKGTGIGLYSVKKVVENHQGSIVLSSAPDQGATFEITFPFLNRII
jgi:signal transduction histidine kinase